MPACSSAGDFLCTLTCIKCTKCMLGCLGFGFRLVELVSIRFLCAQTDMPTNAQHATLPLHRGRGTSQRRTPPHRTVRYPEGSAPAAWAKTFLNMTPDSTDKTLSLTRSLLAGIMALGLGRVKAFSVSFIHPRRDPCDVVATKPQYASLEPTEEPTQIAKSQTSGATAIKEILGFTTRPPRKVLERTKLKTARKHCCQKLRFDNKQSKLADPDYGKSYC